MSTAAGVSGPIDFVLLEFSADKVTGEAAAALFELVEQGIIRIYKALGGLRDNDVLTEDEFAAQKAKLLAAG